MDSTGLRVLLRARATADEGHWEIVLRNVPPNIRRLFDMTGVHEALPRRGDPEPGGRYTASPAVGVAQLVELLVVVQVVAGSSPVAHPSRTRS